MVVEAGLTLNELAAPAPGIQLYTYVPSPPVASEVRVVFPPGQIDTFGLATTDSAGFTVTVTVCGLADTHPAVSVAVTVYVVVVTGLTVLLGPVKAGAVQLNVYPPNGCPPFAAAFNVVLCPTQIVTGGIASRIMMVGWVMVALAVFVQPFASVMVQVYTPGHNPEAIGVVCPLFQR